MPPCAPSLSFFFSSSSFSPTLSPPNPFKINSPCIGLKWRTVSCKRYSEVLKKKEEKNKKTGSFEVSRRRFWVDRTGGGEIKNGKPEQAMSSLSSNSRTSRSSWKRWDELCLATWATSLLFLYSWLTRDSPRRGSKSCSLFIPEHSLNRFFSLLILSRNFPFFSFYYYYFFFFALLMSKSLPFSPSTDGGFIYPQIPRYSAWPKALNIEWTPTPISRWTPDDVLNIQAARLTLIDRPFGKPGRNRDGYLLWIIIGCPWECTTAIPALRTGIRSLLFICGRNQAGEYGRAKK